MEAKSNVWMCHEDAPAYKMDDRGTSALSNSELLSLLLGGTPKAVEQARNVINNLGGLREISRASVGELVSAGLTKAKAQAVTAAFELGRRKLASENQATSFINSGDIARYLIPLYGDLRYEVFGVVTLNRKYEVIRTTVVHTGTISSVLVSTQMIFKQAVNDLASSVVLFHNHPSGNPQPSKSDDSLTKALVNAGSMLEIPILDHLIVARQNWYSYGDHGRIRQFESENEATKKAYEQVQNQ